MRQQFDNQNKIQQRLDPGERLLWWGQPNVLKKTLPSLGIVFFAIPWTAFAVFWVAMAYKGVSGSEVEGLGGFEMLFPLFGVPFILVGLGMLSSPYFVYRTALKTFYAVTDKRCMFIRFGRNIKTESYGKDDISTVTTEEKADGSGNVYFTTKLMASGTGGHHRSYHQKTGFIGIKGVREVERLIKSNIIEN